MCRHETDLWPHFKHACGASLATLLARTTYNNIVCLRRCVSSGGCAMYVVVDCSRPKKEQWYSRLFTTSRAFRRPAMYVCKGRRPPMKRRSLRLYVCTTPWSQACYINWPNHQTAVWVTCVPLHGYHAYYSNEYMRSDKIIDTMPKPFSYP